MGEIDSDVCLVEVTKDRLLDFLKKAQRKILMAKPGYSKEEIETLLRLVTTGVETTVYVDPDETVVRYGFGEVDALKMLKDHAPVLDMQTISGIRLSIVVVDDRALIFTPAALSWEKEPRDLAYPNGLEGGKALVDKLLTQFSPKGSDSALPKNITNFPTVTIQEIKEAITEESLKQTIEALEQNPPVDPAALRQVNIYRNLYKLVKCTIRGAQVKNKTLDLRPFNKLFPESNWHLKRSWQVFTPEDVKQISQFPEFVKEVMDLMTEHALDVGRHGYLILLNNKKTLEGEIKQKKDGFMESLKKDDGPGKALQITLDQSKIGLTNYLVQEVNGAQSPPEALFEGNRILLKKLKNKHCTEQEKAAIMQDIINDFVENELKFPGVDVLIEAVDVKLDYYDVSDELLKDSEFKERLDKAGIDPREYSPGFEQKRQGQLVF